MLGIQYYQPSEMRWGIRAFAADANMTEEICLEELERCQRSNGINYILLIGNKYGWCGAPSKIPVSQYEAMLSYVERNPTKYRPEDVAKFGFWYQKDSNRDVYRLRVQEGDLKNRFWNDSGKLFEILCSASSGALEKGVAERFPVSVTHKEINKGLLDVEPGKQKTTTFVYNRQFQNILSSCTSDTVREMSLWVDHANGQVNHTSQNMLEALREKLICVTKENSIGFKSFLPEWSGPVSETSMQKYSRYLADFLADFTEISVRSLEDVAATAHTQPDPVFEEALLQLQFLTKKCDQFVEMEILQGVLKQANEYLSKNDSGFPLTLCGPSGSGKTSLLAYIAKQAIKQQKNINIIVRFIGTTARSGSALSVLTSVCLQIEQLYNWKSDIKSEDLASMKAFFPALLAKIPPSRPLYIFLDSLDQLSQEGNGHLLEWLPSVLPPSVRLILSTLPDEKYGYLQILKAKYKDPALFCEVPKWNVESAAEVLDRMLAIENRSLIKDQKEEILRHVHQNPTPLFLQLCLRRSSQWTSYEKPEIYKIENADSGALIKELFVGLVNLHGAKLTNSVLGLMTISDGLSFSELQDVLSTDKDLVNDILQFWEYPNRRLPPIVLTRIIADLGGYLSERGDHGVVEYMWYHRQFWEQAEIQFTKGKEKALYAQVINYFKTGTISGRGWYFDSGKPNTRKMWMLLALCKDAQDWESLYEILTDLEALNAATEGGMSSDILQAYLTFGSQNHPRKQELQTFQKFYYQKHTALKEHGCAVQLALGMPDNSLVYKAGKDLHTSSTKSDAAPTPWSLVYHKNKPQSDDRTCIANWAHDKIRSVVLSPDAHFIAASHNNGLSLSIYNTNTMACVLRSELKDQCTSIAWSPYDPDTLASFHNYNTRSESISFLQLNAERSAILHTGRLSLANNNYLFETALWLPGRTLLLQWNAYVELIRFLPESSTVKAFGRPGPIQTAWDKNPAGSSAAMLFIARGPAEKMETELVERFAEGIAQPWAQKMAESDYRVVACSKNFILATRTGSEAKLEIIRATDGESRIVDVNSIISGSGLLKAFINDSENMIACNLSSSTSVLLFQLNKENFTLTYAGSAQTNANHIAISQDLKYLVSANSEGISLFSLPAIIEDTQSSASVNVSIHSMGWAQDGKWIFTAGSDAISFWDGNTGKLIKKEVLASRLVTLLANDTIVAYIVFDTSKKPSMWLEVRHLNPLHLTLGMESYCIDNHFSSTPEMLISGTSKKLNNDLYYRKENELYCVTIGENLRIKENSKTKIWDICAEKRPSSFPAGEGLEFWQHSNGMASYTTPTTPLAIVFSSPAADPVLSFSHDKKWRVCGKLNFRKTFIWKKATASEVVQTSMRASGQLEQVAHSHDGKYMLVVTSEGKLSLYDAQTWDFTGQFYVWQALIQSVKFSPTNSDLFAVVDKNCNLQLFSLQE